MSVPARTRSTEADSAPIELVRFLIARVDDDSAEIKRRARRTGLSDDDLAGVTRLRAEVAAKRQVIGGLQQLFVLRDQPFEKAVRDQAAQMLRAMAVPYAAHNGYREEWRPS